MAAMWSPERDERLLELWRSGLSASEVGEQISVSRNAVLGRLHRLKEPKRNIPLEVLSFRQRRYPNGRPPRVRRKDPPKFERPVELFADNNPHKDRNVGLIEAMSNQCREIVGDDGLAVFCGAEIAHKSFCRYHAGINYVAPVERQANRGDRSRSVALAIQIASRRAA